MFVFYCTVSSSCISRFLSLDEGINPFILRPSSINLSNCNSILTIFNISHLLILQQLLVYQTASPPALPQDPATPRHRAFMASLDRCGDDLLSPGRHHLLLPLLLHLLRQVRQSTSGDLYRPGRGAGAVAPQGLRLRLQRLLELLRLRKPATFCLVVFKCYLKWTNSYNLVDIC